MRTNPSYLSNFLISVFTITTLLGCSYLEPKRSTARPPETAPPTAEAPSEGRTTVRESERGLLVVWQAPEEDVDGFVIRYGSDPQSLGQEIQVKASEVELSEDPSRGRVFRHTIPLTSPPGKIFVSIAAYRGNDISEFSAPQSDQTAN